MLARLCRVSPACLPACSHKEQRTWRTKEQDALGRGTRTLQGRGGSMQVELMRKMLQ